MYIIQFVSPFDRENMTHSSASGATHMGHIKHFYARPCLLTRIHTHVPIFMTIHTDMDTAPTLCCWIKGTGKEVSSDTNRLSERLLRRRKESLEERESSKTQTTAHEYATPHPLLSSYLYSCCSKNII